MTDEPNDTITDAEQLQRVRELLTAIAREAGRRGAAEIVDLAERTDEVVAEILRRKMQ